MKIDSALKDFAEKYTQEAMDSIDVISREKGLVNNLDSLPGFNIKEAFDDFSIYIKEYTDYKIKFKDVPGASSQEVIMEGTKNNINNSLFSPEKILYKDLPLFVENYINGIRQIIQDTNEAKTKMMENEVDNESIGGLNEVVDTFMTKLNESFDPTMDTILTASGYKYQEFLKNGKKKSTFL